HQGVAVPWNGEHHAAIARMRNHHRGGARQKAAVENKVNALARSNHRRGRRIRLTAQIVAEWAGGVDHHFRGGAKLLSGFGIYRDHAVHVAVIVLRERLNGGVIQQRRALFERGRDHIDQQPRVVKLPVVIEDTAAQSFQLDGWDVLESLFQRKDLGGAESVFAGQQIVDLQSYAVERSFPPV